MKNWRQELLEMLREMVAVAESCDGGDLYDKAQFWVVTAGEILPMVELDEGMIIHEVE